METNGCDRFWFHYYSGEQLLSRETLLSALGQRGIRLDMATPRDSSGEGICLFHHYEPGLEDCIRQLGREGSRRVAAVHVGEGTLGSSAAIALRLSGADDVFCWHGSGETAELIRECLGRWRRIEEVLASPFVRENLAGSGPCWKAALRQAAEEALLGESRVLIQGETGTGKEMMSRLIHFLDPRRREKPFIVVDCTAVVPQLSGSEFFGHEKGAFTSAICSREGAIALADGGTLFLDEVGELPADLQADLLRPIQEGTYKRVGTNDWRHSDFRLVCATNRDLRREVSEGRFRQDLFHRIEGSVIELPPLRMRKEDILPLAAHFAARVRGAASLQPFDACVQEYLLSRDYPGNVRELESLVTCMASRSPGRGPISIGKLPKRHLPAGLPPCEDRLSLGGEFKTAVRIALLRGMDWKEIKSRASDAAFEVAMEFEKSVKGAAHRLKVNRRTLELRRAEQKAEYGNAKVLQPPFLDPTGCYPN